MAGRLSETSSAVNESVASSSTTHGSQRRAIGNAGRKARQCLGGFFEGGKVPDLTGKFISQLRILPLKTMSLELH